MILLDTSGLLAAIDSSQRHHATAPAALRDARGPRGRPAQLAAQPLQDLIAPLKHELELEPGETLMAHVESNRLCRRQERG